MVDSSDPVVILGAGCAGLAAGLRLSRQGRRVVIIEKSAGVGGLAGGVRINGNYYEFGPHIFHTTDPEIWRDIKNLLGSDLIEYKRTIKIKFLGNYFQFPLTLKDILSKLPPLTVLHAGLSLIYYWLRGVLNPPATDTSESVLQRSYGNVLYKLFFKSYIKRVWGFYPVELSPNFARQRIPRMNLLEAAEQLLKRFLPKNSKADVGVDNYVEKLEGTLYTTRQGFSLIADRLAAEIQRLGGVIRTGAEVTLITREGKSLVSIVGRDQNGSFQQACSGVINTLAINEMTQMIQPPLGNNVRDAALALRFRALVLIGIHVRGHKILPSSFMYFREHTFNRISDFSYFGFDIQPADSTLLLAEITCQPEDAAWQDPAKAAQSTVQELIAEGLIKAGDVLETHTFRLRHGYPIYTLGCENHVQTLLNAVEKGLDNCETAGRQGRFQYINTHIAIKMGYEAVDRLTAKRPAASPDPAGVH